MVSILPKNKRKKIDLTTKIPQVELFSYVFLEELKTPKILFKINWPLAALGKPSNYTSIPHTKKSKIIILLKTLQKDWTVKKMKASGRKILDWFDESLAHPHKISKDCLKIDENAKHLPKQFLTNLMAKKVYNQQNDPSWNTK